MHAVGGHQNDCFMPSSLGSSRGEIVRKLILDQLTYLAGEGIVKIRREK